MTVVPIVPLRRKQRNNRIRRLMEKACSCWAFFLIYGVDSMPELSKLRYRSVIHGARLEMFTKSGSMMIYVQMNIHSLEYQNQPSSEHYRAFAPTAFWGPDIAPVSTYHLPLLAHE